MALAISICASASAQTASTRPGMGAIPYSGGTTFRIWAPNATQVNVAGQFNGWSATANGLAKEATGNLWSVDVPNAVAGQQYKFVIKRGTDTWWRIDPRAARVTNSVGNGVIVDHSAYAWQNDFVVPPINEQVVYEMHIGTFNDSPGGQPGTWASARSRLAHLQSLGVNMLLVLPVNEFAGDYSWGYNPAHLFAPESIYGTPEQMKAFIDDAHGRGMGVIIDVVHNHYGPSDLGDSLWCFDGCDGRGGVYFYPDDRGNTQWGDTRPDYRRAEVRQFIVDSGMNWLTNYRADGLRWDSTSNIYAQNNGAGDLPDGATLLRQMNNTVDATYPDHLILAEDLQTNAWLTQPTSQNGLGFDTQWEAQFVHPIRSVIINSSDANRNMDEVSSALRHTYNNQPFQRMIYTESHDEVANGKQRVPSEVTNDDPDSWYARRRSTLGAGLVFTAPGIPMIFQGQEMLEDGWFSDTDPIDWTKLTRYPNIVRLYRDLIALRRNLSGVTEGLTGPNINVFHVNNGTTSKVVAFHRWLSGGGGDDVVVVANFANRTYPEYIVGMPRAGEWKVRFDSDSISYGDDYTGLMPDAVQTDPEGRDGFAQRAKLSLAPYSIVILSQSATPAGPSYSGVLDALLGKAPVPDPFDANADSLLDIGDVDRAFRL